MFLYLPETKVLLDFSNLIMLHWLIMIKNFTYWITYLFKNYITSSNIHTLSL